MRESTPWKVATVVLALAVVVLIAREVTRVEPGNVPVAPGPYARPDPVESPPGPTAAGPEPGPGGSVEDPPGHPPPSDSDGSPPSEEEIREYLVRWVVAPTSDVDRSRWRRALPRLRRWKEQVVPILEGWLRRADELKARKVNLVAAVGAYAELAGPDALPVLRELYRGHYGYAVPAALVRIDSPEAADFLAEILRAVRPGAVPVHPGSMIKGPPPIRELARTLAEGHPDPASRRAYRSGLFRYGSEEDRERMWVSSPGGEDFRSLYSVIGTNWDERWQERYRAAVLSGVESPVEYLRYAALRQLARFPVRYGIDWHERARVAIEAEIRDRPGKADRKKRLEKLLAGLMAAQVAREREEEVRRLLAD